MAFAKTGGKIVVVANYSPSGNIIGHFAENVLPLDGLHANNNNNIELTNGISKLSVNAKVTHGLVQNVTEGNFEEDFLEAHNTYRRRHGVLPLKLDRKLCRYSEEWARHLAAKNILEHRPGSNYGENIYCLYSSDPNFTVNGHTPVDTWYEEVKFHPFGKEPSNLKSGHFSQVVWKASEALGVGVAKNSQGSIYVVANYSPAGNFVGHYVENVPPVKPAFYGEVTRKTRYEQIVEYPEEGVTDRQGEFSQFALDALRVHNEYRRKHGVPELRLSLRVSLFYTHPFTSSFLFFESSVSYLIVPILLPSSFYHCVLYYFIQFLNQQRLFCTRSYFGCFLFLLYFKIPNSHNLHR